jgi:membrane protease YdiL (CAAX protease family)
MSITLTCSCGAQFEFEPGCNAADAICPACGRVLNVTITGVPTAPATPPKRARPWGLWATIGFSLIVLAVLFLLQGVVAVAFMMLAWKDTPQASDEEVLAAVVSNGLCLSIATLVAGPCCVALVCLFARLRRGLPITEYLALQKPAARAVGKWVLILAAFICCTDLLTWLLGGAVVPEIMVRAYETAGSPLLLYLALFVMAPLFEEIYVRGFVFPGIRHSRLGPVGAVLITALMWAGLHVQYDVYAMITIFGMGIVLGSARLATGSTAVTILMHAFANVLATGELLVKVHLLSQPPVPS